MSQVSRKQNSSVNSNTKPMQNVKKSPVHTEVEFRWSSSVAQCALPKEIAPLNLNSIDLNNAQKKSFAASQSSTARSLIINRSPSSSPRLLTITNVNKNKELSRSTDQNNKEQKPLLLKYSQLPRVQQTLKPKKISQTSFSMQSLLNDKRTSKSNISNRMPLSSKSTSSSTRQQHLATNKHLQLHQLPFKHLHGSENI